MGHLRLDPKAPTLCCAIDPSAISKKNTKDYREWKEIVQRPRAVLNTVKRNNVGKSETTGSIKTK